MAKGVQGDVHQRKGVILIIRSFQSFYLARLDALDALQQICGHQAGFPETCNSSVKIEPWRH